MGDTVHSLDVIVKRNLEAAGREAGHAESDGDAARANAIFATANTYDEWMAMYAGYVRGRGEK
jgi:hypothetical protein